MSKSYVWSALLPWSSGVHPSVDWSVPECIVKRIIGTDQPLQFFGDSA